MRSLNQLARALSGRTRLEETAELQSSATYTLTGVAASDSSDGSVRVVLTDSVTRAAWDDEGDTSVELPTNGHVRKGQRVYVTCFGGSMQEMVVSGVVGEGDELRADVDSAADAAKTAWNYADSANDAAVEAWNHADEANTAAVAAQEDAADAKEAAGDAVAEAGRATAAATSAEASASQAASSASSAQQSAATAAEASQQAVTDAAEAKRQSGLAATAAGEAKQQAGEAEQAARQATTHANSALAQLSTVEDVIGTVNWIAEHGEYVKTTDTTIDQDKVYYTRTGSGTSSDPYVYTEVAEPVAADLGSYYELSIDTALSQFVASHLALTDAGLYVLKDASSYKTLLSNTGLTVVDGTGNSVATYGESTTFATDRDWHLGNSDAFVFYDASEGTLQIGGANVTIGGLAPAQLAGSQIWTATADPTAPNYTFARSALTGPTGTEPRVGDIVVRGYYRYTVSSVATSTVLTGTRTSIRGGTGAQGPQGPQGEQGIQGEAGEAGTSTRTLVSVQQAISGIVVDEGSILWSDSVDNLMPPEDVREGDVIVFSATSDMLPEAMREAMGIGLGRSFTCTGVVALVNGDNYVGSLVSTTETTGEQGETGAQGPQGETGPAGTSVTVTSTVTTYAASTSGTTAPAASEFKTAIPTVAQGSYLWTKVVTTFSDGKTATSLTSSRQGKDGSKGDKGDAGTSVTVSSTAYAYATSTSGTTVPASGWQATPKAPTTTEYAWTRTTVTFSDGTSAITYTVGGKVGQTGAKGDKGDKGDAGATGPESHVLVTPTNVDWDAGTATLSASLTVDGAAVTPTSYLWAKDGTALPSTTATCGVTDLNATYTCTVSWAGGTQMGSVDFRASKSVQLYAEAGYESVSGDLAENYYTKAEVNVEAGRILQRVSANEEGISGLGERMESAESSIEQNAEAIALRATKTEAYQSAQPNLAPFFLMPTTDAGYWYTSATLDGYATSLSDGWASFSASETNVNVSPKIATIKLEGSSDYTVMLEVDGSTVSGNLYLRAYTANNSTWAATNNVKVTGDGTYRLAVKTKADPHASGITHVRLFFDTSASGASFAGNIRMSIYQGDYDGPYKPYSGNLLYASQAELKVANDAISARVEKDGVISAINLSSESAKIEASKVEIDGTAIFTAISSDVDDAITGKGYQTSSQVESAITGKGYQTASQVSTAISDGTANLAAKSDTVKRTQRIWYRSNSATAPSTPGTASSNWVTKADDGNAAWTKMHVAISSTHKYIYTCEQYEMADGTVGYTSVLLDNTITVIDGGNVITGSLKANSIDATSGTFDAANIPALTADHIKANVIDAVNNGNGTINADKINVSGISIGDLSGSIGGRNLLLHTTKPAYAGDYDATLDPSETKGWYRYSAQVTVTRTEQGIKFTHSASTTNGGFVIPFSMLDAIVGEESAVLSFDYRGTLTTTGRIYLMCQTGGNVYVDGKTLVASETEWQHFSTQITWPSTEGKVTYGILVPYRNDSGAWFEIRDGSMKLERGNRATDWTPAPEDVASDLSAKADAGSVTWMGTSTTAAATAAKEVVCDGFTESDLKVGATICVRFDEASTVLNELTLNVNGTGAYEISAANAVTSTTNYLYWSDGATITFYYNGTRWRVADTPPAYYTTCTTAQGTANKAASVSGAVVFAGTTVHVNMTNANTATGANLSTGGVNRAIYYGNTTTRPTTSNGYGWKAGTTASFVFDGRFWRYADASSMHESTNAAKTATNFLTEASSTGLMVHPSNDSTTGVRITSDVDIVRVGKVRNRIDDTGMTLYNSDGIDSTDPDKNVVAKFADRLIELGKNSISSIIELCNGIGKISVTTGSLTTMTMEAESSLEVPASESSDGVAHTYIYSSALNLMQAFGAAIGGFQYKDSRSSSTLQSYATVTARDTGQIELEMRRENGATHMCQFDDTGLSINYTKAIYGVNWGYSDAVTDGNGVTTFNPGLGVKPSAVFVTHALAGTETDAVARIAVPMVWSIDSATQVQIRWQRSDTNQWLASNRVGYYWLALV